MPKRRDTTGAQTGEAHAEVAQTEEIAKWVLQATIYLSCKRLWKTDRFARNGSCYTAAETRSFAKLLGLKPITTPMTSPQGNAMAESFEKYGRGTVPSWLTGLIQKQ